jgi:pyruvate dehydrogenase E1 component alpha subunit/2-oxoisovalerate dehydrogenase E1 component alpha subunit
MISHLGAMISVVNGTLMAHRMKGKSGTVGAASIGEGGTSTGACHEALNQAAVEKLPLVLVIADNQYAYSTPNTRQFACESLIDRASGYGVEGHSVDGTDLEDCLRTIGEAVERARSGRGPQMVVAKLLRLCGHGEHDDASYVSAKLKRSELGRDCLEVARAELLENGWATQADLGQWQAAASAQIEEAVLETQRDPQADPAHENWCALATKHLAEGFNQ